MFSVSDDADSNCWGFGVPCPPIRNESAVLPAGNKELFQKFTVTSDCGHDRDAVIGFLYEIQQAAMTCNSEESPCYVTSAVTC